MIREIGCVMPVGVVRRTILKKKRDGVLALAQEELLRGLPAIIAETYTSVFGKTLTPDGLEFTGSLVTSDSHNTSDLTVTLLMGSGPEQEYMPNGTRFKVYLAVNIIDFLRRWADRSLDEDAADQLESSSLEVDVRWIPMTGLVVNIGTQEIAATWRAVGTEPDGLVRMTLDTALTRLAP